jgi:DNA-binding XRE family transcriptional regulator
MPTRITAEAQRQFNALPLTIKHEVINRKGRRFVLIDEKLFAGMLDQLQGLPPLPAADANGTREAIPFARVSIARNIIRQRKALGWSQRELARQAGVNVETLNRIEKARVTAETATIARLDRALRGAQRPVKPTALRSRPKRAA